MLTSELHGQLKMDNWKSEFIWSLRVARQEVRVALVSVSEGRESRNLHCLVQVEKNQAEEKQEL